MTCTRKALFILVALAASHLTILLAGFFAPYDVAQQNRDVPFAPPTHIHFLSIDGGIPVHPFICAAMVRGEEPGEYLENCDAHFPVRFFVHGVAYRLFGSTSNLHLFGVDQPARLFVMGTDTYGRDVFSRLLYGGQVSLCVGLCATAISLVFGAALGVVAGYYGGWPDLLIMRGAELFIALPWLYLLFAIRAFLPLSLSPPQAFMLIVGVIAAVGWARPARLIRGIVLSAKERYYVFAAKLFGGSDAYLMRRHILPQAHSVILAHAALLIPQYVLLEVVLSFFGLGVAEPAPSWGSMLSEVQQYSVLVSCWWLLLPGLMLVPVFLGYSLLADELQQLGER